MDKDSKSVSQTQPESTPKRTRWDPTPLANRNLNDGPSKITERTPSRQF